MLFRPLLLTLAIAGVLTAQTPAEQMMLPVLMKNCAGCHSKANPSGGLTTANLQDLLNGGKHGAAIVPGNSKESLLMQYVRGERAPKMPMGGALADADIAVLAKAIDQMKPLPQSAKKRDSHLDWALTKPKAPAAPAVKNAAWVSNPIDAFVLAKLEAKGLQPAPAADRRALMRRVYMDLVGMPPSPAEADTFLSDTSAGAYEKLVDRLLADSRYGERWARHWLDLARFAESDGFAIDGERPTAWRYRDYVIRSLNKDKPYDVFVKEQIAGDEIPGGDRAEKFVALGFLRMGTWEADANFKTQLRQDVLNELTGTVSQVFLGMTVGCARCHDHKYDPIPQKDFYRLQAFFAPMRFEDRPAGHLEVEHPKEMKRLMRQFEDEAEETAAELKKVEQAMKAKFAAFKKIGVDDKEANQYTGALKNDRDPAFTAEDRKAWRAVSNNARRVQDSIGRYRPVAYSASDVAPPQVPELASTYVLAGGELSGRGEKVEPGFLQAIVGKTVDAKIPFAGGSSGRRTALAEWIASAENPLTARVMANRMWQHHFGDGIVRTPSDFGINGDRPANPELLDYLATQFVEKKWSMKAMHKMMLLSSTYRQASSHPQMAKNMEADPKNELLWRMNWLRLEGEAVRDSILSVSGQLQTSDGGPGVFFDVPDDVAQGFEFFKWFPSEEQKQARRTVYTFQRRSVANPMIEVFDGANMSEVCSRRSSTVVPTQSFSLLNSAFTRKGA
ncbi:MAG TPA: PSD1 and planctomycete cytochrome C domain-containing protein, partial [Bryobacteraceae bacterium]|nr:PSD1 and planctomycete cytochrome C domain-containing protein [Bryobacteraceae bacterium]